MTNPFAAQKEAGLDFKPMLYMDEFLDELFAEGRKPGHIRLCRAALHHFTEQMRLLGVLIPDEITRQHLVLYQGWMRQQAWAESYKIELLKKVRHWLNWMVRVGYLTATPWVAIRTGVTIKKPNPLSDDDLAELFAKHRQGAFSVTPFVWSRRETVLTMLYAWGLREHELVALDVDDLRTDREFVRAINKGGTYKSLPYLHDIKQSWRRYETWRARHAVHGEPAAFISRNGIRMSTNDIWEMVHDLGVEAGVKVNPHRFRDTCATHLLDSDMAAERVQKILGHTNLRQTLQYGRVNDHKVAEALDAAMSPRINGLIFGRTKNLVKP